MSRILVVYPATTRPGTRAFAETIISMFEECPRAQVDTIEIVVPDDLDAAFARGDVKRAIFTSLSALFARVLKTKRECPSIALVVLSGGDGAEREEDDGIIILRHRGEGLGQFAEDLFGA